MVVDKVFLGNYHDAFCVEAREISLQRGDEYANQEDELRTFRTAAELYGCKPSDVARMLVCLKCARMQTDRKKDTKRDLVNFVIYMEILEGEEIEK